MVLLAYLGNDEDALIADFAEYYHVLDWEGLKVETAATLAAELRPSSRSYMRFNGINANLTDGLLAYLHDDLQILIYQHSGKGAKKPTLNADNLIHGRQEKDNLKHFDDGEDFEKAWGNLNG
jgi:hypothetical protein